MDLMTIGLFATVILLVIVLAYFWIHSGERRAPEARVESGPFQQEVTLRKRLLNSFPGGVIRSRHPDRAASPGSRPGPDLMEKPHGMAASGPASADPAWPAATAAARPGSEFAVLESALSQLTQEQREANRLLRDLISKVSELLESSLSASREGPEVPFVEISLNVNDSRSVNVRRTGDASGRPGMLKTPPRPGPITREELLPLFNQNPASFESLRQFQPLVLGARKTTAGPSPDVRLYERDDGSWWFLQSEPGRGYLIPKKQSVGKELSMYECIEELFQCHGYQRDRDYSRVKLLAPAVVRRDPTGSWTLEKQGALEFRAADIVNPHH